MSKRQRIKRIAAIAASATLLITGVPQASAADTCNQTSAAMQQAAGQALQNRMNNVDSMFGPVRNLKPSQLACLDKYLNMDFSALTSTLGMASLINVIVEAMTRIITQMVCTAADGAWYAATSAANSLGQNVTMPGGMGAVRVGVQVGSDGRIVAGAGLPGSYGAIGNAVQASTVGGDSRDTSFYDKGKSMVSNGLDRVTSWFK